LFDFSFNLKQAPPSEQFQQQQTQPHDQAEPRISEERLQQVREKIAPKRHGVQQHPQTQQSFVQHQQQQQQQSETQQQQPLLVPGFGGKVVSPSGVESGTGAQQQSAQGEMMHQQPLLIPGVGKKMVSPWAYEAGTLGQEQQQQSLQQPETQQQQQPAKTQGIKKTNSM
jgi:hypothetical protein